MIERISKLSQSCLRFTHLDCASHKTNNISVSRVIDDNLVIGFVLSIMDYLLESKIDRI